MISLLLVFLQGCAAAGDDHFHGHTGSGMEPMGPVQDQSTAKAVLGSLFDRLDCDLDGTIEQAEVDDHFAQIWLPLDSDASQALSSSEFSRVNGALSDEEKTSSFREADADISGSVSANELRTYLFRLVETLDDDGDLELSRADLDLPSH